MIRIRKFFFSLSKHLAILFLFRPQAGNGLRVSPAAVVAVAAVVAAAAAIAAVVAAAEGLVLVATEIR